MKKAIYTFMGILAIIILGISVFMVFTKLVFASNTNRKWSEPVYGLCEAIKDISCGSSEGIRTSTVTCIKDQGSDINCSLGTKIPTTYSSWGTTHNGSCPSNTSDTCEDWWDWGNKHHHRTVLVAEHYINPETKVSTVKCTLENPDYRACTPEEQCPEECGYEGGMVADGKGGEKKCEATNKCSTHRWCKEICNDKSLVRQCQNISYQAIAIPDSEENPVGKPWETGMDEYCVKAEITPTPEPEATPTEIPRKTDDWNCSMNNSCPHENLAPQCTDGNTVKLPANPHVLRSGTKATINWFQTEGNEANIYFKEVDSKVWTHSVRDIKITGGYGSVVISDLKPNLGYTFGIEQKQGCAGGQLVIAVIVDGPETQKFNMTYWEWGK